MKLNPRQEKFCLEYGLAFTTVEMHFTTRDDAVIWIIKNQFGRRNLSAYDRSILALKLKPVIAAKAKENMLATQNNNAASACQKSDKQIDTKKEIAKAAGVSHDTIAKVEKIEAQATPEIKAALKSGDMSINQAFKTVKQQEKAIQQEERRVENAVKVEKFRDAKDPRAEILLESVTANGDERK